MNIDLDNLDDYINTFKLKNFDDSDDEIVSNMLRSENEEIIRDDSNTNKEIGLLNQENEIVCKMENLSEKEISNSYPIIKEKESQDLNDKNLKANEIFIIDTVKEESVRKFENKNEINIVEGVK